jgi:adenylate cyclase class IV
MLHNLFNNLQEGHGELIFYDRQDVEGPKLSDFSKTTIQDPLSLMEVLFQARGIKGIVLKKRILFIYNQTRIHIDDVVGLGNFMELEVKVF